jgi:hypothetical protein
LNSKNSKSEIVYDFTNYLVFFLLEFNIDQFSKAFLKPNFHPFDLNNGKLYQYLRFYFEGLMFELEGMEIPL